MLADLGLAERRSSEWRRIRRKESAELEREREVMTSAERRSKRATAASLDLQGDDLKRLRGFQFLSAKPLLIVINLDESQITGGTAAEVARGGTCRPNQFLSRGPRPVAVCAKIELEIAQLEAADAAAFLADLGLKDPDSIA